MTRGESMPYIFLHGLGQNLSCWSDVLKCLGITEKEHIYCPSLSSFLKKDADYESLYSAFVAYCEQFQEPIHLCGLSLGGILALHYATANPDKVASLVLIGAQYKMPKKLLKVQNTVFHILPNSLFQKQGISKQDMISLTKSMMDLDFTTCLKKIACPTLVVCGEKDKANRNASIQLKTLLLNANLVFIEHAGHEVNIDAPEALATVLSSFYDEKDIKYR